MKKALPVSVAAALLLIGCLVGTAQATGSKTHSAKATFAAATASTAQSLPRLLREDFSSRFRVRPVTLDPTGDGSIVVGKLATRGHHIHWRVWNTVQAYGVATVWVDNGIPNVAQGTYHGFGGTLHASRVRDGRFTRLTVHYRVAGKLKRWSLALEHLGKQGWTWRKR
jgi:hypothetical protein